MVTRFDADLGAEIAPFATILLRSEAAASSQIENLSSGAKQIALAELGSREKKNASEIVGNVAAMRAALALADRLDPDAALAVHRVLMEAHAPEIAGRLTRNVTVPVSAGLPTDTRRYFSALEDYRRGDPAPIITTVAHAARSAVANGTRLVSDIHSIRTQWEDRLSLRSDAAARRLLDILLRQPVIDARTAAESVGSSPTNASRMIRPLADAGILREFTGFNRDRMWCATDVTDALDAFATRARRRP